MNEILIRALEAGCDLDTAILKAAAPMRAAIERLLQQQPFQPFRLYLSGRFVHEIRCPEHVTVTPATLVINVPDPTAPGGLRWHCTLALEHVIRLEPLLSDEPAIVQHSRIIEEKESQPHEHPR